MFVQCHLFSEGGPDHLPLVVLLLVLDPPLLLRLLYWLLSGKQKMKVKVFSCFFLHFLFIFTCFNKSRKKSDSVFYLFLLALSTPTSIRKESESVFLPNPTPLFCLLYWLLPREKVIHYKKYSSDINGSTPRITAQCYNQSCMSGAVILKM